MLVVLPLVALPGFRRLECLFVVRWKFSNASFRQISKVILVLGISMNELGRYDELMVPQPTAGIDYGLLDESIAMVENSVVNSAQVFVVRAVQLGAA